MKKFLSIVLVATIVLSIFAVGNVLDIRVKKDNFYFDLNIVTQTAILKGVEESKPVVEIPGHVFHWGIDFTVTTIRTDEVGIWDSREYAQLCMENIPLLKIPSTVAFIERDSVRNCVENFEVSERNLFFSHYDGVLYNKDLSKMLCYGRYRSSTVLNIPKETRHNPVETLPVNGGDLCYVTEINVHPENQHYKSVDGVLFSKDGSELVKYPTKKQDLYYIVPSTVRKISAYAFPKFGEFSYVYIPATVVEIDETINFISRTVYCEVPELPKDWAFHQSVSIIVFFDVTEQQFLDEMKELYGEE